MGWLIRTWTSRLGAAPLIGSRPFLFVPHERMEVCTMARIAGERPEFFGVRLSTRELKLLQGAAAIEQRSLSEVARRGIVREAREIVTREVEHS